MAVIGIDLGTSNSAMAYLKDGKPEIIENDRGERTTPSVFQNNGKSPFKVGTVAKNEYPSYPKESVLEVKRLMGTEQKVQVGGHEFRPEEISAKYISYLVRAAEEKLGEKVTEAVITVPAYFTDAQRKATKISGEIAGIKVERIINEPTAAAIAYGLDNMDKDQHILVYDLGGGTFDVSVVELFAGVVEVKASAGNNHLGGMDFDQRISDWVFEQFEQESGVNLLTLGTEDEIEQRVARVKAEAENAKKTLSNQSYARIHVPFIAIHNNAPLSIDLELSQAQFEAMIMDLAESTMTEIDKALKDADLTENDIHEVLLVGGSTRIPFIQKLVQQKFGKTPKKEINPDEAVALGAAVQAGIKTGEIDSADGLMVIDVSSFALGVDVVRNVGGQLVPGFFDTIIPRNSTVPITESQIYNTIRDNQDEIVMGVYQGDDDSQYVKEHLRLSNEDIVIPNIPPAPAGQERIEMKFTYDINSLLHIEATVLSTGYKVNKVIEVQEGVMSDDQVAAAKENLQQAWSDSELYQEVKNVMNRAERMLNEASPADREKIAALLEKLKAGLSANDTAAVRKYEDELTDLLIELV